MSGWRPDEIELRDKLTDELAYVLGQSPGSMLGSQLVVRVMHVLDGLGWARQPTLADPSSWNLPPAVSSE